MSKYFLETKLVSQKLPVVLIFGYPLGSQHLGGLVWIKNVVEYMEKTKLFRIRKVSRGCQSKANKFRYLFHIFALLKGIFSNSNVVILDTYGEAAIWMWILLRLFKRHTKIVTVFHHYEPPLVRHKECGTLSTKYYELLDSITKKMLWNSEKIITVSKSSMQELMCEVKIKDSRKIAIVGCSSSDYNIEDSNVIKDIDFLCIGRLEKFGGIESIWNTIVNKRPSSKLVMAGRCSSKDLVRLRTIGIEHLGIVPDIQKIDLLRRAKVFLFPSIFEGFGMAVGEALSAKMILVAWKIPVFEERFQNRLLTQVKLVKMNDENTFAQEALKAVDTYERLNDFFQMSNRDFVITNTWDDVGKLVVQTLMTLYYYTQW